MVGFGGGGEKLGVISLLLLARALLLVLSALCFPWPLCPAGL